MPVEVRKYINRPVPSNCYLVTDFESGAKFIVDPGSHDMSHILSDEDYSLIDFIVLTHEHFDHIMGCETIYNICAAPVLCSTNCAESIINPKMNLSLFSNMSGFSVINGITKIEQYNIPIEWHGNNIIYYEAQGHSLGGICILFTKYLFTGDSLIKDMKTVTKLKTGSTEQLNLTLELIGSLKGNNLIVCPGHGDMFELDSYDLLKAKI